MVRTKVSLASCPGSIYNRLWKATLFLPLCLALTARLNPTVNPTPQPTILLIDDNAEFGRHLKRLTASAFPDHLILWARSGVIGLDLARQHAAQLRLVVLDLQMPLMDGNTTAVQIRMLAPQAPVMPLTAHAESLPALLELGCVLPAIKSPESFGRLPDLMRQAMSAPVRPVPELAWVTALHQSGAAILSFVETGRLPGVVAADREAAAQVRQALTWLDKYCGRYTTPAREVTKARRLLEEAGV